MLLEDIVYLVKDDNTKVELVNNAAYGVNLSLKRFMMATVISFVNSLVLIFDRLISSIR